MEQDRWLYHNKLKWKGEKKADLKFVESRQEIEVATPPEFAGHKYIISPQDLFVSSANACFMTTLLGTLKGMEVELISYESEAEGILETVDNMKIFTKIIIRLKIKAKETEDKLRLILKHAEKRCLVMNSMKTQVIIEPEIEAV
ncbi:MAG: OsmC family protein [Candidatus Methanoperedens sp.]|nr:OsmC family protein [Candidatus Methanoperedens sp.]MCZ7395347.1 OsmC family protein [Candidatus Methanoperedens sp.]